MPYINIEDKRAAYKRWYLKNRQIAKEYRKILWKSKKNNPEAKQCSVLGCGDIVERHHPDYNKPEDIIWICRFHHRRIMHAGNCSMCGNKILGRGLCNKHYKSERQKIDPEYKERVRLSKLKKK